MHNATACVYRLPDDSRIEEALQRDGSSLWAVRKPVGACMNKKGEWEYEPIPSSRTAAFFARCRWSTPEAAYEDWARASLEFASTSQVAADDKTPSL